MVAKAELGLRVFGVGDGDCILLELPDGRFGLVDSCTRDGVSPALEFLKKRSLAFCCLTHPHRDHFSGLLDILQHPDIDVEKFWYALSDLDFLKRLLNEQVFYGDDSAIATRRRDSTDGALLRIFDCFEHDPKVLQLITGVQCFEIAGVEFVVFGPEAVAWNEYRDSLTNNRINGTHVSRHNANSLSITILVRYGEHAVWLLGDLPGAYLSKLESRAQNGLADGAQKSVKASVLKIPHHGAWDGWFPDMSQTLTECSSDNIIIFSAANNHYHPDQGVLRKWTDTGKTVVTTWTGEPEPTGTDLAAGAKRRVLDEVARPIAVSQPQDVLITIPQMGRVTVDFY